MTAPDTAMTRTADDPESRGPRGDEDRSGEEEEEGVHDPASDPDSPGAALVRGEDEIPEPNEPA